MDTTTIDSRRDNMSVFLSNLEKERMRVDDERRMRQDPGYKINIIKEKEQEGKESCAAAVLCKIYRDALPVDDEYRIGNRYELDEFFMNTIKKHHPNHDGVYNYIADCAHRGSKPAKMMIEAVDRLVRSRALQYYENLDEVDADTIDLSPDREDIANDIEEISTNMNYDQISGIIEDNVRSTVQREVENTKKEDETLKNLQDSMTTDDDIATESAIDLALAKAGFSEKQEYQPSLFNGIMIGKITQITESGEVDDDHIEKKAFFEAVKEFTMWETLYTLDMSRLTNDQMNNLAREYASGK